MNRPLRHRVAKAVAHARQLHQQTAELSADNARILRRSRIVLSHVLATQALRRLRRSHPA